MTAKQDSHRLVRTGALLLMVALLLMPTAAWSQATGKLAGTVTDESGGVLPGVTVTVTNVATKWSRVLITGDDGYFAAPVLPPGDYNVTASLDGFATLTRAGVRVTATETASIALKLEVGEVTNEITVTGDAPLIETSNATLGIVVDKKTIVELPLNGRNFTQLGTLTPGVVAPPALFGGGDGDADAGINGFGPVTSGFSVNGVRSQSNNFLLDGATNNDTFNTGFVLRPPPDAIEEFKILTHSYSAEYGRNAGSVVNVVTKSGSNQWHGSAWWFNRDDSFEERNFFSPEDQPKPPLEQDQFGAALGGALIGDKLFGFGYYEGFRNTRGTTRNLTVFTAAQRAGDFSGAAPIIDPMTGLPFPGNMIPADRINASSAQVINDFMPLPNSGTNRFITSPPATDERDQFGLRLDYRLNESSNILARFLLSSSDRVTPPVVEPIGTTATSELDDFYISHTATINSNMFNQARITQNKIDASPTVTSGIENSQYGLNVPNLNDLAVGLARIGIAGFPGLGDAQQPFVKRENDVQQFTNDFSWLKGRHSFKFGFDWREEEMFIGFINRPNGDYAFDGRFTGNAAADFLLGLPSRFRQASPGADAINEGKGVSWAAYVQDEFRVSSRLTINLGLRYELFEPFVDSNDSLNSFRPGQQSTRFPDAPTGLVYPGDAGVPRGTYETDKNNFAPRIAVTWDPEGNGRSSVRAGWGIFYDSLPGQGDFFQNAVLAPPFNPLLQIDAPPAALSFNDPLASLTGGAVGFPPGIIFIGWGSDFTTPSYRHYNLTYQRQFGDNIGAEIGYVGSRGKNLPIFIEVNPLTLVSTDPVTRGPRLYPDFSLVRPTFTVAESWYDSLQLSVRMRPTKGLNFLFSYTYGDAEDHDSALNVGGGEERRPVLWVDQNDPTSIDRALAVERGPARFDIEHRYVLSFGYDLPSFENKGGFVKALLGGWQLTGIYQMQTGFPFMIRTRSSSFYGLTGRPDLICDPNGGPKTIDEWFDTSCFAELSFEESALRPEGGNMGRNVVRGPGFERVDLSLMKNINLKGDHSLQLRIEAFNAFNQLNLADPGFRIGTSTFGVITATNGDGRIIQLGLKYSR